MSLFFDNSPQPRFLPTNSKEMKALGWDGLDILLVSGDAYIDQPSFGVPLLGRWLVAHGYKVGIIAQPDWRNADAVQAMGRPRLFAGVSAGALDSLLAHYTAFRKKRHDDAYTPGGRAGARPNRACIIYTNLLRQAFPHLPIVLGGIEASLRRLSHYDFWTDSLRRSLLLDAKADLLIYGMGERAILETARKAEAGKPLQHIAGTAWAVNAAVAADSLPPESTCLHLPSHEALLAEKSLLVRATLDCEMRVHTGTAYALQECGNRAVVLAPPAAPLSTAEMDALYDLPFSRRAHPSYSEPIPADTMMRVSITSHRGCGGGCSFCSLALHQGRRISSRSQASLLREVEAITASKAVAISDVGGPTANMWQARCASPSPCRRRSCCYPKLCRHFITPQHEHVALLRTIAAMPKVKQVRVASGVRADIALRDADALAAYTMEFTGGQLKVAPEHCADAVLQAMRKPPLSVFEEFLQHFLQDSRNAGREQYVVPYLMSAFPGCTAEHMQQLADWLKQRHWAPQQVQCFIPTPGTVATAMFYAEVDEQGNDIVVARSDAERLRLHGILMPEMGNKHAPQRTEQKRNGTAAKRNQGGAAPLRGEKKQQRPMPSKQHDNYKQQPAREQGSGLMPPPARKAGR